MNDFEEFMELDSYSHYIDSIYSDIKNKKEQYPLLSEYLNINTNITKENFLKYVLDNFEKINDNEYVVLNKNLFVGDYLNIMFHHVLDNHVLITEHQFKEYIFSNKSLFNHFKTDYQQQLITYYAFNYFNAITDDEWRLIFEPVYKHDSRHLFANISFNPNDSVLNKKFWSYFSPESNIVKSYLAHITTNQLHKSMSFMCEHFGKLVYYYLYENKDNQDTIDTSILEKHYIYSNPQHCTISQLTYEDLYQVFSRIYKKIPNKDLDHIDNKDFYDKLEKGIYYLFDCISYHEPEKLRHFFENCPKELENMLNDLGFLSYELLNSEFQDKFCENVLGKNIDLIVQHSKIIKQIMLQNPSVSNHKPTTSTNMYYSTPIKNFLKKQTHFFSHKDQQHILFNIVKNMNYPDTQKKFIEELSNFSSNSLKKFMNNIDVYVEIINDNFNQRFVEIETTKETINKVILNQNLNIRFSEDTSNKIKRNKI